MSHTKMSNLICPCPYAVFGVLYEQKKVENFTLAIVFVAFLSVALLCVIILPEVCILGSPIILTLLCHFHLTRIQFLDFSLNEGDGSI